MKSLFSLIIIFLLSACSIKFDVQKRKYNKGLHWSFAVKRHLTKNPNQLTQDPKKNGITLTQSVSSPKSFVVDEMPIATNVTESISPLKMKILVKELIQHKSFHKKTKVKSELKKQVIKKFSRKPDNEKRVPGTVLFILVCVLAGLFTVAGIGYLILFLSTSAITYLIFAAISAGIAALFFFIMNGMNQVE